MSLTAPVPVAELNDANVVLGGRPIIRDVNLKINTGEAVALLGANGAGKSTVVRALLGLLPLSRGEARLFGVAVADLKQRWRVGFVPQRSPGGSGTPASVAEVVASGRLSRRRPGLPASPADRRAVRDAIEAIGLSDRRNQDVATLSGGQYQRVLIARALASEPELLILDEPTAGVDLHNQQVLADILADLSAAGATLLVVAHGLGPMAPLIGRTVVLDGGRVAWDGPPRPEHVGNGHEHHLPEAEEQSVIGTLEP